MNQLESSGLSDTFNVLVAMPGPQLVLLGLAAATWLIGANVLIALHYRRLGKSAWSRLVPFAFSFGDLNSREWLILATLGVLSLTLGTIAIFLSPD